MDAHNSDYQPHFDEDFLLSLTTDHEEEEGALFHQQHQNPPNLAASSEEIIMAAASSSIVHDMRPILDGSEGYEDQKITTEADGRGVGFKIALRTKSDIEVMDDGFRWRKYGKKKVKNSPNPRNYYRCSTPGCNVKKRVQREREDPSFVITTYEGKHNHESPAAASSCISHNNDIDPPQCTPHKLQLLRHDHHNLASQLET